MYLHGSRRTCVCAWRCRCQLDSSHTRINLVERPDTRWGPASWLAGHSASEQQPRMDSGARVLPHWVTDSTTSCVTGTSSCTSAAARPHRGLIWLAAPQATHLDHLSLQLQQGMLVLQDVAVPLGHRPHVPHEGLRLSLQLLRPRLDDAAHIHALQGGNRGGLAAWGCWQVCRAGRCSIWQPATLEGCQVSGDTHVQQASQGFGCRQAPVATAVL